MNLFTTREIQSELDLDIIENSGHEPNRDYLGMSQINQPERELVAYLLAGGSGKSSEVSFHERMRTGHVFEAEIKARLIRRRLLKSDPDESIEIVADFDNRFRGHADGELVDGSLLEIKSVTAKVLAEIRDTNRLRRSDFAQTQLYLHHGGYAQAVLIYIARDTGETWATTRRPDAAAARTLNEKARWVLAEFDRLRAEQYA